MSTLFYELKKYGFECIDKELNIHLLINHDEHVRIYQQIAKKLGLTEKNNEIINKPTSFILKHETKDRDKVDVIIVDEAHLLLTQGKMF